MEETTHAAATPAAPLMHFDAKDVANSKVLAALSYVGLLFLVPLLAKKDSKFAQENAKQGLVVVIAAIALHIIAIIPILGWAVWLFGMLALGLLDLFALVKCLQGEFYEIPLIGQYRKEFKF